MSYVFLIILTKEKNKMLRQRNFRFNSCTESMKMTLTFLNGIEWLSESNRRCSFYKIN